MGAGWGSAAEQLLDVLGDDVGLEVDQVAGAAGPSVVRARVSGMRLTVKVSSRASTTVRLTPSTVIEPLSTR